MAVTEQHVLIFDDFFIATVEVDTEKSVWDADRVKVIFDGFGRSPLILTNGELSSVNDFVVRHTTEKK